jgi:orotate phosphoribosyltransferase-like protein
MSQFKRLVQEILDLTSLGLSDIEVAREVGVSRGVVDYVVETYGGVE